MDSAMLATRPGGTGNPDRSNIMFNPQPSIDRSASDLAFAREIQAGGLPVARQRYDYNKARRIVSAIKRKSLPDVHYAVDGEDRVWLFRLDNGFFNNFAEMAFFCHAADSLQTAVMAAARPATAAA